MTTIINNLADQVKFNTDSLFVGKKSLQCKLVYFYSIALTAISKLYVHKVTSSSNFSSNKDDLYFPPVHISLMLTIVMLITFPPMSVKWEKNHYYKIYSIFLLIQVFRLKTLDQF